MHKGRGIGKVQGFCALSMKLGPITPPSILMWSPTTKLPELWCPGFLLRFHCTDMLDYIGHVMELKLQPPTLPRGSTGPKFQSLIK